MAVCHEKNLKSYDYHTSKYVSALLAAMIRYHTWPCAWPDADVQMLRGLCTSPVSMSGQMLQIQSLHMQPKLQQVNNDSVLIQTCQQNVELVPVC